MAEEMVLTPGGYRPKSKVQQVEAAHALHVVAGRLQIHDQAGKIVADLGEQPTRAGTGPLMPEQVSRALEAPGPKAVVPAMATGWVVYAYWNNGTGKPITTFKTTWIVPPAPATRSGQIIFLFNGIQNSSMIYQPVLQWGVSAAGGGNYWAVASWYVDGQGGGAFHSPLVQVSVGQTLVGIMTQSGQSGSLFSYNCQFQGIPGASLAIKNVQELTWCAETLECYGLTRCSDYPATQYSGFQAIDIQTGSVNPPTVWTPNSVNDCGQKCVIVSNSPTNGEVDLYYGEPIAVVLAGCSAVASNRDGRLEVFGIGTDHALWHDWQVKAGGTWSGWNSLGGVLTSDPTLGRNADGRLEAFVRGTDDALWHNWQTSAGGGWSGWASLGGAIISDPFVSENRDGRLEAFARGTDNALWHIWQVTPGGGWSGWNSLAGVITSDPIVGQNADGRLEAFARGTDNALWHIWQVTPNGGWSGWNTLGGTITSIVSVGRNKDGRLEVFARGTDNAVWHIWQTSAGGGWSGWASLGGVITSDPVVSENQDGRLEVFARGTDNAVWHIWQMSAGGGWSGWASLAGGITSDLVVAQNADGRLEVFGRGTDNALWHIWQTAANNGWSGWASLGGVLTADLAAHA
jgi:acylphosphatase